MARSQTIDAALLTSQPKEVGQLLFDVENPRITAFGRMKSQDDILTTLWREFAVDEVALSIAANGFFGHEPLFATREHAPSGKYVVIEGNRRLAAVMLLREERLRRLVGATDLPAIDRAAKTKLDMLPVIVCRRDQVWQYLGFKHVNGPQSWDADSKAQYIAWVHENLGVALSEIARTIGDKHQTVERLYRARTVLEQAGRVGQFDRDDRFKKHFSFSHLYTGLGYSGIQQFIGLSDRTPSRANPVGRAHLANLGKLLRWMYGSRSRNTEPIIQSQNPDLRYLDEVLQSSEGIVALDRGLPLRVCLDISRGDERLFREAIQASKQHLQKAIGTLVTGYAGEDDLLRTGREIKQLAGRLVADMEAAEPPGPGKKKRRN